MPPIRHTRCYNWRRKPSRAGINHCHEMWNIRTSAKVTCPTGSRWWECNITAAWGQMAQLAGTKNWGKQWPFLVCSQGIGGDNSLKRAWKKQGDNWIAIKNKEYHKGVPTITVVIDGGRSHRQSYNGSRTKTKHRIYVGAPTEQLWYAERYKQTTASRVPAIANKNEHQNSKQG